VLRLAPNKSKTLDPIFPHSNCDYDGLQKVRKGIYLFLFTYPHVHMSTSAPGLDGVARSLTPLQKLSKLAAPSPFELTSTEEGKRKIGENKLLSKTPGARLSNGSGSGSGSGGAGKRYSPYALPNKCKDCRSSVTQNGAKYCHSEHRINTIRGDLTSAGRLCVQEGNMQHMQQADSGYQNIHNVDEIRPWVCRGRAPEIWGTLVS
jgi:Microtubule-associated protein CRIPT